MGKHLPRLGSTRRKKEGDPVAPTFNGWLSSDEQEVSRRRYRGETETFRIEASTPDQALFGAYRVSSDSEVVYVVEIRSGSDHINSCGCPDHAVNQLGTCKHIEAVLAHQAKRLGKRRFNALAKEGSPQTEIFLDRRDTPSVRIQWGVGVRKNAAVRRLLAPFFSISGKLIVPPAAGIPALKRAITNSRAADTVLLSRHLDGWIQAQRRATSRAEARREYLEDVADNRRTEQVVNAKLYPYQREGMLHLAFTERAILADEMGLGKTIQAIAASELLRRLHGVERVLVVSPASLKMEWEEQIRQFTGLPVQIIDGTKPVRLSMYRQSSFFYLANYEQVRNDYKEIQSLLAPEIIILDEAQRLKNWQTKTAQAVKQLKSPYVFVLSGTPIENRIDELYSIMQVVDPHIFGPLFRFNRDFYQLDDRGRPVGYRNLDELHRRLRPVLCRRLKSEVEDQLPSRTINNYFVEMSSEQRTRYDEYSARVARLFQTGKQRSLKKDEQDSLQQQLACMRMLCDTPYILDEECRDCPKLTELEDILKEVLSNPSNKVIIFSEWQRMLELVRELLHKLEVEYSWHTGEVSQSDRREEIKRFKTDAGCRVFLSSDAGSTGLNLQTANTVINLDMPWNPAKLEQRIARAWRKNQKRAVQVINLICLDSIEHRMLSTLSQKQTLASSVLDPDGAISSMPLPSGRSTLCSELDSLMTPDRQVPRRPVARKDGSTPADAFKQDMLARYNDALLLIQERRTQSDETHLVVVLDTIESNTTAAVCQLLAKHDWDTQVPHVIDRAAHDAIELMTKQGLIEASASQEHTIYRSTALQSTRGNTRTDKLAAAEKKYNEAERKMKMASILADSGFVDEAKEPAQAALEIGLEAAELLQKSTHSPGADAVSLLERLRDLAANDPAGDSHSLEAAKTILDETGRALNKATIG